MATLHALDLTATAHDTGTGWEHALLLDGEVIDTARAKERYRVVVAGTHAGRIVAQSWHRSEMLAARARSQRGGGRAIPVEVTS